MKKKKKKKEKDTGRENQVIDIQCKHFNKYEAEKL